MLANKQKFATFVLLLKALYLHLSVEKEIRSFFNYTTPERLHLQDQDSTLEHE